ncbi:hypothetical protein [Streptomyces sp. NPDC002088]
MQHRRPRLSKVAARQEHHVSGIEAGGEIFKGSGRLDTKAYSVGIG